MSVPFYAICDTCGAHTNDFDVLDHGTDLETGYRDEEFICACCAAARAGVPCQCSDCEGRRIDAARDWYADLQYRDSIGD